MQEDDAFSRLRRRSIAGFSCGGWNSAKQRLQVGSKSKVFCTASLSRAGINEERFPDMTTESIMTARVHALRPTDTVADALPIMQKYHVRNLPVVDESGAFVGLFGIRSLNLLLLPEAATILDRHSISDLAFLPDDIRQMEERWQEIARQPVSRFLHDEKDLLFCKPDTSFPQLLELLQQSPDCSLPVIIVDGETRRLVGMVSMWDVVEGIIIAHLVKKTDPGEHAVGDEGS